jgi:hypothetical protein
MSIEKPEIPEDFPDISQIFKGKLSTKDFAQKVLSWFAKPEAKEYRMKLAHYAEFQEAKNVEHLMERLEDLKKRGYEVASERVPLPKSGMATLVLLKKEGLSLSTGFPDFFEPAAINQSLKEILLNLDLALEHQQNGNEDGKIL